MYLNSFICNFLFVCLYIWKVVFPVYWSIYEKVLTNYLMRHPPIKILLIILELLFIYTHIFMINIIENLLKNIYSQRYFKFIVK